MFGLLFVLGIGTGLYLLLAAPQDLRSPTGASVRLQGLDVTAREAAGLIGLGCLMLLACLLRALAVLRRARASG